MASLVSTLPTMPTLFSAYASFSAIMMLFRTAWSMVPDQIRDYISSKLNETRPSCFFPNFTYIIDERLQAATNQTFRAVEAYLPTRVGRSVDSLLVGSYSLDPHNLEERIPVGCRLIDEFQGMKLEWSLHIDKEKGSYWEKRYFRLKCDRSDREKVKASYIPHIDTIAKTILSERNNLHIYTYDNNNGRWASTVFKHPATFDTLAMDPARKKEIINDLNAFKGQRDFFQRVGRPWKRGYLLHGPPGTGKSSLVAAIANHLRYNIYDLQLQSVGSDAELRRLLTSTTSRSILLVEDIDCSTQASRDGTKIKCEQEGPRPKKKKTQEGHGKDGLAQTLSSADPGITLSGLLNFIDGLWSSCGEEKVIICTTNHKEKLDPALLRPGRMDFDVYMGYCTFAAFAQLAGTYLQIKNHDLFTAIDDLLKKVSVTPAEVAQQLMKCGDPQAVLESFIKFLKIKGNEIEEAN